ncbi:MAG: sulfatase, partial [Phycisphaeraceae bacterium]|nr:sulfatase [Phycisphaeraceae bacterium]
MIKNVLNLLKPSLILLGALVFSMPASAAERPNVLFLISDDLSAEALGCYGNRQVRTPHIDALATRSMRFTRAYCQYPVCGPSRAALMSGLYCQTIGVTSNGHSGRFAKNLGSRPTMSQLFMRNGYHAARVSKIYHMLIPGNITHGVHGPDHAASWHERYSFQAPEWMSKGEHEHLSNEKLKRDPDKHYRLGFGGAFYVVKGSTDGSEQNDVLAADKAIELIGRHKDKPFFLAVGMIRPHVPLVAPKEYFEPYPAQQMKLPEQIPGDWEDIPKAGISKNSKSTGLDSQLKKQKVLSAYYASVQFMDAQIGRILKALDDAKLRDKTIVIFCSDHGYHLGEHEFWQKMSLHEESARIPLLISAPKMKPGVSGALAEQIDYFPTLAELAGLKTPPHCQGRSLVPVLKNPEAKVREAAYTMRRGGHMLRTERWAYLQWKKGEELYDMQ